MTEWAKAMNRRQAAGQCRFCANPQKPGRTLCEKHLAEAAARRRRVVEARKAAGVCVEANCGAPPRPGGVRCESCTEIYRIYFRDYKRRPKPVRTGAA